MHIGVSRGDLTALGYVRQSLSSWRSAMNLLSCRFNDVNTSYLTPTFFGHKPTSKQNAFIMYLSFIRGKMFNPFNQFYKRIVWKLVARDYLNSCIVGWTNLNDMYQHYALSPSSKNILKMGNEALFGKRVPAPRQATSP